MEKSRISEIPIRYKSTLIFLLPLMAFLFMLNTVLNDKWKDYTQLSLIQELFGFSVDISGLVIGLQQERGLTELYLKSDGDEFEQDLKEKQIQTDLQLQGLRDFLSQAEIRHEFPKTWLNWASSLDQFSQLDSVRLRVEQQKEHENFFNFYSSLTSQTILLFEKTVHMSNLVTLEDQMHSYYVLLWLMEYAGRERGRVGRVLASGELQTNIFKEISGYVAFQQQLKKEFLAIAPEHLRDAYNNRMTHPSNESVDIVRSGILNRLTKTSLLNRLHSFIGYGGLIHHFKNYVIRGERYYYLLANELFVEAAFIIRDYRRLPGLTADEHDRLLVVEKTLKNYIANLDIAASLHRAGESVAVIDEMVKIDDAPALEAISWLREVIVQKDAGDWFQDATVRIEIMNQILDQLKEEILVKIAQKVQLTWQQLILYSVLSVILVLVTLITSGYLILRLSRSTRHIEETVDKIAKSGNFSLQIDLPGNDEYSRIGHAINYNLGRLRHAFDTINNTLTEAAAGNFKARIQTNYQGDIQRLRDGVNSSLERISVIHDDYQKSVEQLNVSGADLTRAKQKAELNERRSRLIVDTALDAIITTNRDGCIETFNPAAQKIFNYSVDEVLGQKFSILLPESQKTNHHKIIENYMSGHSGPGFGNIEEGQAIRKGGEEFPVELAINSIHFMDDVNFICVLRDITKRLAARNKLYHMATTDDLTGLVNRNLFNSRLDDALKLNKRNQQLVGLLLIDVDKFKKINDTFGHPAGDLVLKEVAELLIELSRETDTAARLGGDEFAVLVVDPEHSSSAEILAKRIMTSILDKRIILGHRVQISLSVGISCYPANATDAELLIKTADEALYQAKEAGGNQYRIFTSTTEDDS